MQDVRVVRAQVELFPGSVSGKTTGYQSGVRPNHFFDRQDSAVPGSVTFEGQDWLDLGASCAAIVRFVYPSNFQPLAVGATWRIQEGSCHVGNGRVTAILDVG